MPTSNLSPATRTGKANSDPSIHISSAHQQHRFPSSTTLRRDDSNLLKKAFKLQSSDSLRQQNPRTSMSQLKLKELAQQHVTHLERFGMEELRDGFFDPIYSKPTHVGDSQDEVTNTKSTKLRTPVPFKTALIHHLRNYCKHWRIITKFTLAYSIAILLCVIDKPGAWFGNHRVWLPISVLINHPVHNIGAQAEITLLSIIGLAIGLGWSSLALYISTATQPTRNHQGGILAGSLLIGLFFMGWFKAYYIRFYYMLLTSGLALIFLSTNLHLSTPEVHWKYTWEFAIPYLFGLLISLTVSLFYFPYVGREKMIASVMRSTSSIKNLLHAMSTVQRGSDTDQITGLQKEMIESILALSENFREFLSGTKLSLFHDEDLKNIRNHLNFIIAPLRVIPTPLNIYFNHPLPDSQGGNTKVGSTEVSSGVGTPVPKRNIPQSLTTNPQFKIQKEMIYVSIMDDHFNEPLFKLISQMILQVSQIEDTMRILSRIGPKSEFSKQDLIVLLTEKKQVLKKRVQDIDVAYRKFTKTDYFCRDILNEESVINIFLVLRYTRQAAVMLFNLTDTVIKASENVRGWRLYFPNYPLYRGLRRLPEQCLRDQGADDVFHYFETKIDVDDAFERIYNLNTSRNKDTQKKDTKVVRAIDHKDFNFHSTKNPFRYKLWVLLQALNDTETKYAAKVSFVALFLSLPAWLNESWKWYWTYNCYWCPILLFYFLSPKNSSNWENFFIRIVCWFVSCFWGWAANASRHYQNHVVIAVFAVLFCLLFSYGFLVLKHPRSSFIGLLAFTIVSQNVMVSAESNSKEVFEYTWTVSVAILVSIVASIFSNWIIWPFIARRELFKACSQLLQHIGQSYQSVSERYLYRDENDDPTELTLELANIREVRMSQSVMAVKLLLKKSRRDHFEFSSSFKPELFVKLLDSCDRMLEKMIEARMSGVYFKVWEQDKDLSTTQALLSFRRDSVATVIYLLYIISNAFMTKGHVPKYLPSAIGMRKRLYDFMAQLESERELRVETISEEPLNRVSSEISESKEHYEKTHWTEVHGMAFARAFTAITEELESIVELAREILGEGDIFD